MSNTDGGVASEASRTNGEGLVRHSAEPASSVVNWRAPIRHAIVCGDCSALKSRAPMNDRLRSLVYAVMGQPKLETVSQRLVYDEDGIRWRGRAARRVAPRDQGTPAVGVTARTEPHRRRGHRASTALAVPHSHYGWTFPSSSAMVAVDGLRSFCSLAATASAWVNTRMKFSPATFRSSASDHPRRASSASR